jgi:predicted nucleic acid-binding protein
MIVFIDTGVLGLLSNPNSLPLAIDCETWLYQLLARGAYVVTSEMCNYEARRGLLISQKKRQQELGIKKLDRLKLVIDFLSIEQEVAENAARIWAQARLQGTPTANEENIDIDMIIAAHWFLLTQEFPGRAVIVSTTNVKHLGLFTDARNWKNINL